MGNTTNKNLILVEDQALKNDDKHFPLYIFCVLSYCKYTNFDDNEFIGILILYMHVAVSQSHLKTYKNKKSFKKVKQVVMKWVTLSHCMILHILT